MLQLESSRTAGADSAEGGDDHERKTGGIMLERLIMALTALDQDVEIRIRKKPKSRKQAHLQVVCA